MIIVTMQNMTTDDRLWIIFTYIASIDNFDEVNW